MPVPTSNRTQESSNWLAFASSWRRDRPVPGGIRITRVGLWYVLLAVIVAAAATNTGNNALYLVLSLQLALLGVSGVTSRWNVRGLRIGVEGPRDVFAGDPALFSFRLENAGRFSTRRLLLVAFSPGSSVRLVPALPPGASASGQLELLFARRGLQEVREIWVSSLFPLGLFRKGMRYPLRLPVLVYPQLFQGGRWVESGSPMEGDRSTAQRGWGHETFALRDFRPGDDPRAIHWKKTAQLGSLVARERESEERRHLTIELDNATGPLRSPREEERFERLVSEAATAAVEFLEAGFSVELVTRSHSVPAGAGPGQRRAILETLALLEPVPRSARPLPAPQRSGSVLRLSCRDEERAA